MAGPWRKRPGAIFFRFLFSFGFLMLLGLALFSVVFVFFSPNLPGPPTFHALIRAGICVSAVLFSAIIFSVTRRIFKNIASPLGEVMDAAEAVAEGDLSARVPEPRGAFRQLSSSFNRMADELERADNQRRNLTADVAHELRNPLHILQGSLEGVLDGIYEPDEEQIRSMLDETRLLSRLVDDLQTLSLADAGQIPLQLENIPVAELLRDVHTSYGATADAHAVSLHLHVEPGMESMSIPADYERLQQVLGNLVTNALQHTPEGGRIDLSLRQTSDRVLIVVEDTGRGIAPEDLPFIFDRFWKGDRARTRRPGSGSGLGLAITRQFVKAHGGTITAESTPEQGTRFTIRLPVNDNTV